MAAGGTEFTFFFAWVHPNTAWDLSLARFDENIFSLLIEHDEGQIPAATVEIKNPRVGLISAGRQYWTWISYSRDACDAHPLFYGRLLGIPEQIMFNTIKMKFIARPTDYIYQKQHIAESLKVMPNYDPIFLEITRRDDPDTILEGWSALYHVDRVNNRVSASDILVGEDGTVAFAGQDVFYDSVQMKVLQSPLAAVNVKADVQWQQQYRDHFLVGQWAWPTLGSDAFVGDWPKSGTNLGGGWTAGVSWAGERNPTPFGPNLTVTQTPLNFQWVNQAKTHRFGDTMSISINYTPPFGNNIILREVRQIGIQNPYAVDGFGDPAPVNIPAKVTIDWFCWLPFTLNFTGKQSLAMLSMIYAADRKRSEKLELTVKADVQHVLIDPLVTEDTEQITLKSGDLSQPFSDLLNWSSVGFGGSVSVGQIIFPDNPLVPGQTSSQIAVQGGTTGMTVPTFSNIAGQTTADGSVVWASLGETPPTEGSQDWVRLARVGLGTLLLPKPISGVPDLASIMIPGSLNFPPTGTAVSLYSIFSQINAGPGDLMYECNGAGMLGGFGPQATFSNFTNPSGQFLYLAVQAGTSAEFHPTFNETVGGQTTDGGIIWQNIGQVNLPIGGWPGMTPAASYFPTDRGLKSVEHMLCRARAKLRKRARAVEVSFDTRFEAASQLSCRMNASIHDPRLPGGSASGKVISYKLQVNGDSGVVIGNVTLGCSIGNQALALFRDVVDPFLVTDPGIPSYVGVAGTPNGYVNPGYQVYYSSNTLLTPGDPNYVPPGTLPTQGVPGGSPSNPPNWPTLPPTLPPVGCPLLNSPWSSGPSPSTGNDIGYTPPASNPNDDGIIFPAAPGDLMLRNQWHGIPSTINPLNITLLNLQLQQIIRDAIAQSNPEQTSTTPGFSGVSITYPDALTIQNNVEQQIVKQMLQGNSLWYELVLKPLTNGPFANYYVVDTTVLAIPKTIDLAAS